MSSDSPRRSLEASRDLNEQSPTAATPAQLLQPDGVDGIIEPESTSDTDSAFGGDFLSTTSTSLASSILDYKYENGRRYHAYKAGQYLMPNDELEQARLDLHHHLFRLSLQGGLYRSPLSEDPHRILDLGTGTGIWAIEMADDFPGAQVLGTDLSPIQPSWVPQNLKFMVDDMESDWVYREDEAFDFVHARGLSGAIADWPRLYQQIFQHTKPGGWVEMQEYDCWIHSDDDTINNAKFVGEWQLVLNEAGRIYGRTLNVAPLLKQLMIEAGFVDVRDDIFKVPIGSWAKDPRMKELGVYQLEHMTDSVEAFTLAPLTRIMGWPVEKTEILMAGVRADFRNRRNHLHTVFHFVCGRRP